MEHFIFGDMHQSVCGEAMYLSKDKFTEQKELTKENILFQLGDFGYFYSYPKTNDIYKREYNKRKELASKKFTFFIIPGNHENYDLINELPLIEKWGGLVYEEKFDTGSLFIAKRGEIYTINGKTIFTFSGALSSHSSDKYECFTLSDHLSGEYKRVKKYRYGEFRGFKTQKIKLSMVNYWSQELPTEEELAYAKSNLEKVNYKVDYVFTHTGPSSIINDFIKEEDLEKLNDPVSSFLDKIYKKLDFKHWYFGHCHTNITKGKFSTHYLKLPKRIIF